MVSGSDHSNDPRPKAVYSTDDISDLGHFNRIFNSKKAFFKENVLKRHLIIPNIQAFISSVQDILTRGGLDIEIIPRLPSALPGSPIRLLFRNKGDVLSTSLDLIISQEPPEHHFTEKQCNEAKSVYDIRITFLGDVALFIALGNFIEEHPIYLWPRREGVYEITFLEMFKKGGTTEIQAHELTTEDFKEVRASMYPGIDIEEFISSYQESDENIAIFIGEPGTGKTSILKLILREAALRRKRDIHATYVKDRAVLHDPAFWAKLGGSSMSFLILDDLDHELLPRDSIEFEEYTKEKGSGGSGKELTAEAAVDLERKQLALSSAKSEATIVNQLLSFSNGLFQSKMKILITTNLENTKIDPAIVRPGRCFDILRFPKLTVAQALDIWVKDFQLEADSFSKCFADVLESKSQVISQSLLSSEAAEIRRSRLKGGYLLDKSISVRDKYQ